MNTTRKKFSSDLTDTEWKAIEHFFKNSRLRKWHKRELLNGVFYVLNNGIKWRELPDCFPPWATVYTFYIRARNSGLWDEISAYLVGLARKFAGRDEMPTYGIIDSQSVKTVYSGEARGIDGGKKNKRKKTSYCC